jgi:hypothetical protein
MLTLENFVGLFVGSALALMLRPALRRRVLFAVILTGLLTAAWYAPVLSKSFGYENPHGHPLPWYGFVQAPLRDLLGAQLNLLVPSLPVTAGAAIAAGVLLLGAVTCWLRWERMLALLTLVPCLTAYLLLEAARAKYAPRFGSFTLPPLLVLAALGLADLVRYLCRTPQMQRVLLGLVAICLAVVLARFMNFAASFAATPYEAAKSAGQIITGLEASDPRLQVVSNVDLGAFDFYAAPTRVRTLAPASLIRLFCARGAPFVYLQNGVTPRLPSTTCLTERGAFQIQLRERRAPESLWIVPG